MTELSLVQKIISLILKFIVIISVTAGVIVSAMASSSAFMGGDTVFMYFTIQSNILMAIICLIGIFLMFSNNIYNKVWHIIKLVGTVSITLTGVVFCLVLAPTMAREAWTLGNILTHVIVPLSSIIDFFVVCSVMNIRKINVLWVTVPPILYAIYAGIGYARGWEFLEGYNYPYFFLNWGSEAGAFGFSDSLPFMGPVWWILILLAFLIIVGFVYLLIADAIRRRFNRKLASSNIE